MKKFVAKKHNKYVIFKLTICILLGFFTFWLTLSFLLKNKIDSQTILNIGTTNIKVFNIDLLNPKEILSYGLSNNIKEHNNNLNKDIIIDEVPNKKVDNPIVYIYNTHDTEEYTHHLSNTYNIAYTVKTASYILRDYLLEFGINAYVEEESTSNYLKNNNMTYTESYKASRYYLNKRINEYNTLKYFIDIHRDAVEKSVSTTKINDKNYARVLFVVGCDNKDYKNNLDFVNSLNNKIENNISRGILKQCGKDANGIYNQDISSNSILLEVGGKENNIDEVNNTMRYFASILKNNIKGD